ncbi:MAG: tRNA epoxyqueuosine(34) reductase QueG [bacterium]|nr:tRNA epoxyqueuosine(34) reductase QueG [bacterium]
MSGPFPAPAEAGLAAPDAAGLRSLVLELSRRHGFDLSGIAPPALDAPHRQYLQWIGKGYAGEMTYLTRDPEIRKDLRNLWPDTRSALVVAVRYRPLDTPQKSSSPPGALPGKLALYAHGGDYHKFLKKRLLRILKDLQEFDPGIDGRSYVDTGPILERDLAARAGLGWKGKNSLLLSRELGSYFFLGVLLLNREIPPDSPVSEHCGTCERCITDCPTGAIVAPGVIDARRCISYLTIELRGPMDRSLRPLVGNHFFGCDICQEVCPWNDGAPAAVEARFSPRPGALAPNLIEMLGMDETEFQKRFQGTPVMRARHDGFLRNVAVAIGNTGGRDALPALARALRHRIALVRGHAAWALGRIGGRENLNKCRELLEAQLQVETDEWVLEEIELALGEIATASQPLMAHNQKGNER